MNEGFVPLHGHLRAVEIVFAGIVAIALIAIVSGILELSLLNRVIAAEPVTDSELDGNDVRQALVGLVQTIVYLTAAVVFIVWLHRAYKNVDAWIASAFAGQFGARIYLQDSTPEELREGTIAYLVSDSLDVVTAILAILVVRATTRRLQERAATTGPGSGWLAPERPTGAPA